LRTAFQTNGEATENFHVTPFAGALFFDGLKPQPNTGIFDDLHRPSGFLVGVRASRVLNRWLAVEFTLSRSRTENIHQLLFVDPDPPEGNPPFGIQTLRNSINPVLRLGGNVLLTMPLPGPFSPHITTGLGWVRHAPRRQVSAEITVPLEDGSVFSDTISVLDPNVRFSDQGRFSFDVGGGLTADVNPVLAVRLDAILHVSRFSPLDVDGPLTGNVFYADTQWMSDWEVSTGLLFAIPREGWTGGPVAGVTVTRLRGDDVIDSGSERKFFAGVALRYRINSVFSIQPEFLRLDRTVRGRGVGSFLVAEVDSAGGIVGRKEPADLTYRVDLKDLEIPLLVRLTIPLERAVKPYLVFGPALSMNIDGGYRFEYEAESLSGDLPFHRSFGIGLSAGGGAEIDIGVGTIFFGARYMGSQTRIDDTPDDFNGPFDVRSRVWMFRAGFMI
jgi:hypothetical protein